MVSRGVLATIPASSRDVFFVGARHAKTYLLLLLTNPASRVKTINYRFFFAFLLVAAGCALDPEVGKLRNADPVGADAGVDDSADAAERVSFVRDIRPIFTRAADDVRGRGCKECHYPGEFTQEGVLGSGLSLKTLGGLRAGGRVSGASVVIPGNPQDSLLIQKLEGRQASFAQMPKGGPFLRKEDIALIRLWISQGAKGQDSE
jgi:Planctomycete cytochrome C